MNPSSLGLAFSLGALFLWSLSPFFFTSTSRRIGAFATNLLRLLLALPLLLAACAVEIGWAREFVAPEAAAWIWLILSGAVGLAIGDHFLYTALSHAGPERTSLLMTLSPAATAALGWFLLRETLSPAQLGGMVLVLVGVVGATWKAGTGSHSQDWTGTWNGIAASLCQAGGAVLARQAFLQEENLSPVLATTLRVAAAGFILLAVARWRGVVLSAFRSARNPQTARRLMAGTVAGPVAGMLSYVAALKFQPAGIVTTITFMAPLLIIPLGTWRYGTRMGLKVLLGGVVALAGVVLLGWDPGSGK